jgi:hypothetical protein
MLSPPFRVGVGLAGYGEVLANLSLPPPWRQARAGLDSPQGLRPPCAAMNCRFDGAGSSAIGGHCCALGAVMGCWGALFFMVLTVVYAWGWEILQGG